MKHRARGLLRAYLLKGMGEMSLDFQSFVKDQPWLAGVFAAGALLTTLMSAGGYLDPAMHKSDMNTVVVHVAEIENALKDNRAEHGNMQLDIRNILQALGRIEGRIGPH